MKFYTPSSSSKDRERIKIKKILKIGFENTLEFSVTWSSSSNGGTKDGYKKISIETNCK